MNHLAEVQKARAALKAHQTTHPTPAADQTLMEWWMTRRGLIESLLAAERAAIDAGDLEDFSADF